MDGTQCTIQLIGTSEIVIKKSKVKNICNQLSSKVNLKKINIKILFQAINRDEVYKSISEFMANFINEADVKFNNLSHFLHVYLVDSSIDDTEFDEWL